MAQEAVGGPVSDMKDQTSIIPQLDYFPAVLDLLTLITMDYGATFSIYTSKKGRTWAAFKTWGDNTFSSASEVPIGGHRDVLIQAILVAGATHLVKMKSSGPMKDSWRDLRQTMDTWGGLKATVIGIEDVDRDLGGLIEAWEGLLTENAREEPKDSQPK